jgi:hypothetical protein
MHNTQQRLDHRLHATATMLAEQSAMVQTSDNVDQASAET